ncbi:MAG: transglutaminase domain-containing protein [Euryarchaeota archaeon]|nr:transglutaminase domain-containing protein [Euryarchaeota archaeon]
MRTGLGSLKGRNFRNPAMAAGALFLALLVMFPHLPLPWYRPSDQIDFETAPHETVMPGADTDGDGLYDNIERKVGTDPLIPDTDDDGLTDGQEYRYWYTRADRERAGNLTARWLVDRFPREDRDQLLRRYMPDGDLEGDRLTNILDPDSDGDTLRDGAEIDQGTDPADPDTDGDGIRDDLDPDNSRPGEPTPPTNSTNRTSDFRPVSSNLTTEEQNPQNFSELRRKEGQVLFYIEPADRPRYWRLAAYDTYRNGSWLLAVPGRTPYNGENLPQEVERPLLAPEDLYRLTFNNEGTGFLPNALHTTSLAGLDPPVPVSVDRMQNFFTPAMVNAYDFRTFALVPGEAELEAGRVSPATVAPELTAMGGDLPPRVRSLAMAVTEGRETPAARIKAILAHLKTDYLFTPEPPAAPPGTDPLDRFLFETRQGSSLEFASAFVALCRYNDLPCRLATGFALGDLVAGKRAVRAGHFHAWAEVLFDNLGWVQFEVSDAELAGQPSDVGADGEDATVADVDPETGRFFTGGTGGGTTRNETDRPAIVNQSATFAVRFGIRPRPVLKGSVFEVCGTVVSSTPLGAGASVLVLMNDTAVGRGRSGPDGVFSVLCNADSLPVGRKSVGLNVSVQERNIVRWARTPPNMMQEVDLCSNASLQLFGKNYAIRDTDYNYTVRLRDAGGMQSPWQEYVGVFWNGTSLGTVECGEKDDQERMRVVSEPGPHELSARFAGTKYLFPSDVNRTIWVKAGGLRLQLTSTPADPVVGGQLYVETVLSDASGRRLQENISLSLDGRPAARGPSGSILRIELDETVIGSGLHRLTATCAGNELYPETVAELSINIRGKTRLELESGNVSLGTTRDFSGTLRDNLGDPVSAVNVNLRWADTRGRLQDIDALVFADGGFSYRMYTAKDTPPGGILVTAEFKGDAHYTGCSNTTYIRLTSSSVFSASTPRDLTRGEAFSVNGTLSDHLGRPVPGSRVTLQKDENLWGAAWTDGSGDFGLEAEVPSGEGTGPARLELRYAGDDYREPAVLAFNASIYTLCRINLSVPERPEQGARFRMTAVLVDDRDQPVSGENLTVRFGGRRESRTTDESGRAVFGLSFPWLSLREELQVTYAGGNYTRPASARTTLEGEPVMMYRVAAVLAAAALFAAAYYMYRRLGLGRRPEEVLSEMLDRSWLSDKYRKTVFKVYTKMLAQMRSRGHPRREAWTVHEYESWLQRRLALDLRSLQLLTLIFEEARYSRHRLDGTVSRRAVVNYRRLMDSVSLPEPQGGEVPLEVRNAG